MSFDFSERDLENFLWENPNFMGGGYRWLGRQVVLQNGWIIDLVGLHPGSGIEVVEVKKGQADGNALSQVMAYQYLIEYMVTKPADIDGLFAWGPDCEEWDGTVCSALVAPSFEGKLLIAAMNISDLRCVWAKPVFAHSQLNLKWFAEQVVGGGTYPTCILEGIITRYEHGPSEDEEEHSLEALGEDQG